ncbi:MAG: heavy metal-binding domain-containing protein [Pseudomonadota bacterium]
MTPHDHSHGGADGHGHAASGSFTCPMHPEVVRPEPGKCPICGMTLVPLAAAAGQKT